MRFKAVLTALLVVLLSVQTVSAAGKPNKGKVLGTTSVTVGSNAELIAAMKSMGGGGTILLKPGNYGVLGLYGKRDTFAVYKNPVEIASLDPKNPAVFNQVGFSYVQNITLRNLKFDYVFAPGDDKAKVTVSIANSTTTRIYNSDFDGDLARGVGTAHDGYGYGIGLGMRGVKDVIVEGNKFHKWHRGMTFSGDTITVRNNDVFDIRSDGTDLAEVSNTLVEGNHYHDFRKSPTSGDHMDMIQMWSASTNKPSENVTIRKNVLDRAKGDESQSIFMRNELVDSGKKGKEFHYKNFLIEDNIINNSHSHGITVGETDGLTIRRNTILQSKPIGGSEALVAVPTINMKSGSTKVLIEDNIVPRLSLTTNANMTVRNNVVLQRLYPYEPAYYGNNFVNALADTKDGTADIRIIPGSELEQKNVGSPLSRFDTTPEKIDGYILNTAQRGLARFTHDFDASNVFGPAGKLAITSVSWNFGDGKTGTGIKTSHTFPKNGMYAVTADVKTTGGETITLKRTAIVEPVVGLYANFDSSAEDQSELKNVVTVNPAVTYVTDRNGKKAVQLNGTASNVAYAPNIEFNINDEYTIFFDFKKNSLSDGGYALYGTSISLVSIGANDFKVNVSTDKKSETIYSGANVGINDLNWHRIAVTFSGTTGEAVVYLDNKELKRSTGYIGAVQRASGRSLGFGSAFGSSFQGALDNLTMIRGALSSTDIKSGQYMVDTFNPSKATSTPLAPTLTLTSSSASITSGQSATLTWTSANTSNCTASNGWNGSKSLTGSESVSPTANATYTLTCTGAGGTVSKNVSVTVNTTPTQTKAPTLSFSATPLLASSRSSVVLTWASTNATACVASGSWSGSKAVTGTESVGLVSGGTYTLTCTGAGGAVTKSLTPSPTQNTPPTTPTPRSTSTTPTNGAEAPVVTISATPGTVTAGQYATIQWTSTGATSCAASGAWSGTKSTNGSSTFPPRSTGTYFISCTGAGGTTVKSAPITVVPVTATTPTVTFSGTTPKAIGATSTLTWSSKNTTSCTATGEWSGTKSTSGSEVVIVTKSPALYSISCAGTSASGAPDTGASASVMLLVDANRLSSSNAQGAAAVTGNDALLSSLSKRIAEIAAMIAALKKK